MTKQITDPFYWEDEKWVFLRADDAYSLFDPKTYGLNPTEPCTACWKGFVVQFKVREKQLYLDTLLVYCEDNHYPPINGVESVPSETMGMQIYEHLNISLSYSGTIIVGIMLKPEYRTRAFTGPHSYTTTFELTFVEGLLVKSIDTSGQYFGI